jgi:hypothetical protein
MHLLLQGPESSETSRRSFVIDFKGGLLLRVYSMVGENGALENLV